MAKLTVESIVERADSTDLSDGDLLLIYRDALRGKESDYARRIAVPEDYGAVAEQHIATLEEQAERLKEVIAVYEQRVEEATPPPADVAEPPPVE